MGKTTKYLITYTVVNTLKPKPVAFFVCNIFWRKNIYSEASTAVNRNKRLNLLTLMTTSAVDFPFVTMGGRVVFRTS